MTREKGEWYPIDLVHEKSTKPREINGKIYHMHSIFTNKTKAETQANKMRKLGANARIIPLTFWGKLYGYPDSIPHKKQVYVIFRYLNK